MPLITVVLIILALALLVGLFYKYVAPKLPFDPGLLNIAYVVLFIGVVLWLLYVSGVWDYVSAIHVGHR